MSETTTTPPAAPATPPTYHPWVYPKSHKVQLRDEAVADLSAFDPRNAHPDILAIGKKAAIDLINLGPENARGCIVVLEAGSRGPARQLTVIVTDELFSTK